MATDTDIVNEGLSKLGEREIVDVTTPTTKAGRLANRSYEQHRDELLYEYKWNFALYREQIDEIPTTTFEATVIDVANNEINIPAHGYSAQDGPLRFSTDGDLPSQILPDQDYFVVNQALTNTPAEDWIGLSLTTAPTKIVFSDQGTGTHELSPIIWGYQRSYQKPSDALRIIQANGEDEADPGRRWRVEGNKIVTDLDSPLQILYLRQITDPDAMTPTFRELLSLYYATKWALPLTGSKDLFDLISKDYRKHLSMARSHDAVEGTVPPFESDAWIEARYRGASWQRDNLEIIDS